MSEETVTHTEQAPPQATAEEADYSLAGFFAIGLVINLALITAYCIWAYRHWGNKGKGDE